MIVKDWFFLLGTDFRDFRKSLLIEIATFSHFFIRLHAIGRFRITFSLFLKASLGAHPFI